LLEQAGFTAVDNRITAIHHWCPGQRTELERFSTYLLQFISPELPALLATAASPAAAEGIREGHDRFARLSEQPVERRTVRYRFGTGVRPARGWHGVDRQIAAVEFDEIGADEEKRVGRAVGRIRMAHG
jgi:hypothetical protein